jgi:phospholipid-binding lipoprotein MlaA
MFIPLTIHKYFALTLLAVTASLATTVALATEPTLNDVMQLELPETLVDAVPQSDSFTSSVQLVAEQEYEGGPPMVGIADPWEGFNRSIYSFNLKADKYVLKPVATAYNNITPEPVKHGVRNFFSNLKSPVILVNELLQGRPMNSAETLGRFAVNTTVGVVGIFDPASAIGLVRRNEDFGQTLGVWGWENSNYVVLPLLGPRTMRDVVGFVGDMPLSPLGYADGGTSAALQSLEIADKRVQMMPMDDLRDSAIDEYAMVRDAWSQSRNQDIKDNMQPSNQQEINK